MCVCACTCACLCVCVCLREYVCVCACMYMCRAGSCRCVCDTVYPYPGVRVSVYGKISISRSVGPYSGIQRRKVYEHTCIYACCCVLVHLASVCE